MKLSRLKSHDKSKFLTISVSFSTFSLRYWKVKFFRFLSSFHMCFNYNFWKGLVKPFCIDWMWKWLNFGTPRRWNAISYQMTVKVCRVPISELPHYRSYKSVLYLLDHVKVRCLVNGLDNLCVFQLLAHLELNTQHC